MLILPNFLLLPLRNNTETMMLTWVDSFFPATDTGQKYTKLSPGVVLDSTDHKLVTKLSEIASRNG